MSVAPRGPVPAAAQTLTILRYLAGQPHPVAAATLARELDLPRSTTYGLLATLAEHGFVVHLADDRRYALGLSAYELSGGYARQAPLQRLARLPIAALVDSTGESAHLAVLHGREVVYVIEERAAGRPPLVTDVGVRLPAALTASGRAVLATLPAPQLRALFPGPSAFVDRTGAGPRSLSALRTLLSAVRRDGYAVEDGDISSGLASVAAAVLDPTGYPVAAVACTFPHGRVAEATTELAAAVQSTAGEVSRRLGRTQARTTS